MFFFVTKFVMGELGPQKFSTFRPSDASRKNNIKFHLMCAIVFHSPCFCLSNHVWHEQIVSCTIVKVPNNFKCHGTIFALFDTKKLTTVKTLYSTIYYSKYFIELNFDKSTQYVALWTHKRHPIPRPFGRAMECLLWVFQQKLTVL